MLIVAARGPQRPPGPPPPLLPKPGKDNLHLQRLLRKAARRKMTKGGPPAPPGAFRASLSPVSEASHDQETTAPRPAEAPPVRSSLPRSPHPPVIHHVASPLQKSTFSFSLTQRRTLAAHFKAMAPQLAAPTPEHTQSPSAVLAPAVEGAHISQVHIQVVPSPPSGTLEPHQMATEDGPGDQDRDTALCPPGAQSLIPVAHIRPLPAGTQATSSWPELPPVPKHPPSSQASVPREASTRVVVPLAPTYCSPGPSPYGLASAAHEAEQMEQPPTVGSVAEVEQVSSPCRAWSPAPASGSDPCPALRAAPKPRLSGWTRLRNQLMEPVEEAPVLGPEHSPEHTGQKETGHTSPLPPPPASRASRMWDAVLYRMSVAEARGSPAGPRDRVPTLAGLGHLPFLCRPRFNARKLQEVAARAPLVIPSVLELSPGPKNFNRTAVGWRPG
ncbi:proline-rich protein 33 [Manis pentadactyla]|uniref:proline-rich protein 33 n=1 Tax=Manis pentadactyla TaxID=143292 RepID=UPI00255CFD89|nr:proline-rich protein 33 [Manis pentadactyla]XP_057362724.1 proline-rich protein 33 [Manis pentadactyla]